MVLGKQETRFLDRVLEAVMDWFEWIGIYSLLLYRKDRCVGKLLFCAAWKTCIASLDKWRQSALHRPILSLSLHSLLRLERCCAHDATPFDTVSCLPPGGVDAKIHWLDVVGYHTQPCRAWPSRRSFPRRRWLLHCSLYGLLGPANPSSRPGNERCISKRSFVAQPLLNLSQIIAKAWALGSLYISTPTWDIRLSHETWSLRSA